MKLISGTQIFKSDLSDSLSKAIEACESVVAAGYECRELQLSVDSAIEALKEIEINGAEWYLSNHKDNTEVVGYLGMSVENLTGFIAEEGVKEMAVKAWEKIKEFFKKLWGYVNQAYQKIADHMSDSKLNEIERNLNLSDPDLREITPVKKIVSFATIDEMYDLCKEMKDKYEDYSKHLRKHLAEVEDAVEKPSDSKKETLNKNAEKLRDMVSDMKKLSDKIKDLRDGKGEAEGKSLFQLGYTLTKIPRIFFISRSIKSSIKNIKETEEKVKVVRDRLAKMEISGGKESLDGEGEDGLNRTTVNALSAGLGIGYGTVIGPTVVGGVLIALGALAIVYELTAIIISVFRKSEKAEKK